LRCAGGRERGKPKGREVKGPVYAGHGTEGHEGKPQEARLGGRSIGFGKLEVGRERTGNDQGTSLRSTTRRAAEAADDIARSGEK